MSILKHIVLKNINLGKYALMYKLLLIDLYGEENSYLSRLTQGKHRERKRKNS